MANTYLIAKTNNFNKEYSIIPSIQGGLIDENDLNITEGEPETTMTPHSAIQINLKEINILLFIMITK